MIILLYKEEPYYYRDRYGINQPTEKVNYETLLQTHLINLAIRNEIPATRSD